MRKIDDGKKFNVEKTRYFDYHPSWLEQLIEKSFPKLARKKYEPPYKTLWPEVKQRKFRKTRRRSVFHRTARDIKTKRKFQKII